MGQQYILEMKDISKTFPGVKALNDVTLNVRSGTVHGLMGENGAGKSTLMKILQGIYTPTTGEVLFEGQPLKCNSIQDALNRGISMIHQEMSPIPEMSVAENIYLGREPQGKLGFINHRKLHEMAKQLLDDLELSIPVTAKMKTLSMANMQMIEIAKAISFKSKLIIMDEPTSAITEREVDILFSMIDKLKKRGVTIIYITHKMDEVFQITDDITVLCDGRLIGSERSENLNTDKLIRMMVGRELKEMFPKEFAPIGEELLRIENFSDGKRFKNVSFTLHAGEILGFAGLMGAGRSEVLSAVFGIAPHTEGKIFIRGKEVKIRNAEDAIKCKIAFLTEDRKLTGAFLPLTIEDNMLMSNLKTFSTGPFLKVREIRKATTEMRHALNVRTPSMKQRIVNLSGGNQQKALVARWMLNDPDILIVDEPTRGIDVNAKAEIHKLLCKMAKSGKAIILVSSEMPEVIGMSDRIMTMHEGRLTGEINYKDATQEKVMLMCTQ